MNKTSLSDTTVSANQNRGENRNLLIDIFSLPVARKAVRRSTRTNTFDHLAGLCRGKRIVCERNGKRIELTTPDGGTTAECESVAEALDTVRHDSTFASLPIKL